jgi:hypothetical protein
VSGQSASTAPAYSLAAVIVIVGVQAPAVLLASFVPMFFIAAAFYYMNRADQDCGTTFSWVTRALGPWPDVAARCFYLLERRGFEAQPRDFTPGEPAPELAETPAGKS